MLSSRLTMSVLMTKCNKRSPPFFLVLSQEYVTSLKSDGTTIVGRCQTPKPHTFARLKRDVEVCTYLVNAYSFFNLRDNISICSRTPFFLERSRVTTLMA